MQSVLHFPEEIVAAVKKSEVFGLFLLFCFGGVLLPFLTYLRLSSMEKFSSILVRNL